MQIIEYKHTIKQLTDLNETGFNRRFVNSKQSQYKIRHWGRVKTQ